MNNKAKDLEVEIASDVAELAAVAEAEAAIADTADGGNDTAEAQALVDAKAAVNTAPTVAAGDKIGITDFGMVSNDMARAYLTAKGVAVKFEEPVDVKSNYYMKPIGQ